MTSDSTKQRAQTEQPVAIPWLAALAQLRPPVGSWNPFGDREEPHPSAETTRRVLDTSAPILEAEAIRSLDQV